MRHVQLLKGGVWYVDGLYELKDSLKPPALQQRFELLRATDPDTYLKGIGYHLPGESYWIYEDYELGQL